MRIAVVVTTYNRPDALAAVLAAYAEQTDRGFDLIVADDGSSEDTGALVRGFAARAPVPVAHVWQPDRGFRAAAIRNRAVAACDADYVVFTDGDCIPSPAFVARHRALAEPGWFVAGNRVLLREAFSRRALAAHLPLHRWGVLRWAAARLAGDANRLLPLLVLPAGAGFRTRHPARWEGVKTCNLAVWRRDLVRVNGLDESYEGWGLEDSDLAIRLLHAGVRHKSARFHAPVFHLWHAENDRSRLPRNRVRLGELLAGHAVRATLGLDRHLAARGGE